MEYIPLKKATCYLYIKQRSAIEIQVLTKECFVFLDI
jgi:hypothetical protein